MPDALTITFPMPLNLANARLHWRVKHNAKVAYWETLDNLQTVKRIPAPPKTPWTKVRVASVMVVGAAMDDGNAMNRHKWVEDWLVTRGYLVDDSKKHLTWDGVPTQRISRKEPASITLTLTQEAA